MKGVYLHILGDALGSIIVIISAIIVKYVKNEWTLFVDPAMRYRLISKISDYFNCYITVTGLIDHPLVWIYVSLKLL